MDQCLVKLFKRKRRGEKWVTVIGYESNTVWIVTDLQPLDDVSVVFRCRQARVSSGSILSRKSPVEDALLHYIIGLDKQVVHLTVQVHWDGNSSALSWLNIRNITSQCFQFVPLWNSWCNNMATQYLTYVWQYFNASLHRGLLNRVKPVTVVDPEHSLKQLNKNWLTSLQNKENVDNDKDRTRCS